MIWQGSIMSLKKRLSLGRSLSGVSIVKRSIAEKNNQRVRNPVTPSRMTVRGQFPSKKMQRMIAWESQLERRACYLFEFSPAIVSFQEQPECFHIPYQDKVKRYTPDFALVSKLGEISYCEIKPLNKVRELKTYFNQIDYYLKNRGFSFLVLTDDELIHPVREANLVLFRYYQSMLLDSTVLAAIYDLYSQEKKDVLTIGFLGLYFKYEEIYSAISNGDLVCDFHSEITPDTEISLPSNMGDTYEKNFFYSRTAPYF